jgi:hypothetical protein
VNSGQASSLQDLVDDGGAKHHLAGSGDRLRFLGDVIAIRPLEQVVSVGDVFTYGGVMVLIVAGMGRRARSVAGAPTFVGDAGHVDG